MVTLRTPAVIAQGSREGNWGWAKTLSSYSQSVSFKAQSFELRSWSSCELSWVGELLRSVNQMSLTLEQVEGATQPQLLCAILNWCSEFQHSLIAIAIEQLPTYQATKPSLKAKPKKPKNSAESSDQRHRAPRADQTRAIACIPFVRNSLSAAICLIIILNNWIPSCVARTRRPVIIIA